MAKPPSPSACTSQWIECTTQLAETTPEAIQLLQVRRLQQRLPQLSSMTSSTSIREVNLLVIASFLGNQN